MKCNFLISIPNRPLNCLVINQQELYRLAGDCNESLECHTCALDDACRLGAPCCKSALHSHLVSTHYGLPPTSFYIETRNLDIFDADGLITRRDFELKVLFRLLGGKGGFGALLKGQGSRKKPSENIDSCRNLQGQRIRTVRLEQQVKEWESRKEHAAQDPASRKLPKIATSTKPDSAAIIKRVDVSKIKSKVAQAVKQQVASSKGITTGVDEKERERLRQQLIEKCIDIYDI